MPQRVIHSKFEGLLSTVAHAPLGSIAGGMVAAVGDDVALPLLAHAPAVSLLFFSRESFDYALRELDEADRERAVAKRMAQWSPNAVNEGTDWLYRSERRCLTLTVLGRWESSASVTAGDHFEHTMTALHRLTNEGAYGSTTMPEMLINVLRREALLLAELSRERMSTEISDRNEFSLTIAQELRPLGHPEFAEHLPYAEPVRAAFVSPPDEKLRASLKSRRLPVVDWHEGFVSMFGTRDLEQLAQQGRKLRILYCDGRQLLQDLTDLTSAQLEREFEERSKAGAMPFWNDYLNSLRLDIALMRRAAHAKASAGSPRIAAVFSHQLPKENALLMSELASHPSWRNAEYNPQHASVAQAESDILEDAKFLARLSALRGPGDMAGLYQAFAVFKAKQLARLPH